MSYIFITVVFDTFESLESFNKNCSPPPPTHTQVIMYLGKGFKCSPFRSHGAIDFTYELVTKVPKDSESIQFRSHAIPNGFPSQIHCQTTLHWPYME